MQGVNAKSYIGVMTADASGRRREIEGLEGKGKVKEDQDPIEGGYTLRAK